MKADYYISSDKSRSKFDCDIEPVCTIVSGQIVSFETTDENYVKLASGVSLDAMNIDEINIVTGPVYIEGASEGDALKITILDIEILRCWSVWDDSELGEVRSNSDLVVKMLIIGSYIEVNVLIFIII